MADAVLSGHESHGKPNFFTRWFMSTNHKDIGILYLFTAAALGFISVAFTAFPKVSIAFAFYFNVFYQSITS